MRVERALPGGAAARICLRRRGAQARRARNAHRRMRRFDWYFPTMENPAWPCWGAVVELALRRLEKLLRAELTVADCTRPTVFLRPRTKSASASSAHDRAERLRPHGRAASRARTRVAAHDLAIDRRGCAVARGEARGDPKTSANGAKDDDAKNADSRTPAPNAPPMKCRPFSASPHPPPESSGSSRSAVHRRRIRSRWPRDSAFTSPLHEPERIHPR